MTIINQLIGHTSEDTAYVVDDYPYGFRQRTKIRYWVETKPKLGQRFVSQTLNPKTGNWNKPKASTYNVAVALYLDENDHVKNAAVNGCAGYEGFKGFADKFQLDEYQQERVGGTVRRYEQVFAKQAELKAAGKPCEFGDAYKACVLDGIAKLKRGEELAA